MKMKRFKAKDMRSALESVTELFGEDAVIVSTHNTPDGVEVVAAIDYDDAVLFPKEDKSKQVPLTYSSEKQKNELSDFTSELHAMRHVLEAYLKDNQWEKLLNTHPVQIRLSDWLSACNIDKSIVFTLLTTLPADISFEQGQVKIIEDLCRLMPKADIDLLDHEGVICLVGPTGSGKTTLAAKLGALHVLRKGKGNLAYLTTDIYRVKAYEQINAFAKIFEAPVFTVDSSDVLQRRLLSLSDKKLVIIDTAGLPINDPKFQSQITMLKNINRPVRYCIALPCSHDIAVLSQFISSLGDLSNSECLLTKCDEVINLSGIVSLIIKHRLFLSYLSKGQRIPEDLQVANSAELVAEALKIGQFEQGKSNSHNQLLQGVEDVIS